MAERHILTLTRANRQKAVQGVLRAPDGWTLELREAKRSDDQNRALWGALHQVTKQRPTHNGVRMTAETWKAVFMQALGAEMVFVPTLDGTGVFPMGHRSSQLTKSEFAGLLDLILAWAATEGVTIEHFHDDQERAA
jgi:hypothetical protein